MHISKMPERAITICALTALCNELFRDHAFRTAADDGDL
jgi:hypothetical protein